MWSDWLVFCDYGFSVSSLCCPLATPTVLLRFLLPWTWGISSRLLQQSAATARYLGWSCPSLTWMGSSSSRSSCTRTAANPWFDIVKLINVSSSLSPFFCIHDQSTWNLRKFPVFNTVLTRVIRLYTWSLDIFILNNYTFVPFDQDFPAGSVVKYPPAKHELQET